MVEKNKVKKTCKILKSGEFIQILIHFPIPCMGKQVSSIQMITKKEADIKDDKKITIIWHAFLWKYYSEKKQVTTTEKSQNFIEMKTADGADNWHHRRNFIRSQWIIRW